MHYAKLFAYHLEGRMDEQCPATQDAIDRIVKGWCHDRPQMLAGLRSPTYTREQFCSDLLTAWKDAVILLATGRSQDWWLELMARVPENVV